MFWWLRTWNKRVYNPSYFIWAHVTVTVTSYKYIYIYIFFPCSFCLFCVWYTVVLWVNPAVCKPFHFIGDFQLNWIILCSGDNWVYFGHLCVFYFIQHFHDPLAHIHAVDSPIPYWYRSTFDFIIFLFPSCYAYAVYKSKDSSC